MKTTTSGVMVSLGMKKIPEIWGCGVSLWKENKTTKAKNKKDSGS